MRKNPRLAPWRLSLFFFLLITLSLPTARADAPPDAHEQLRGILARPPFQAWRLREKEADDAAEWKTPQWLKDLGRSIDDFFDWLFRSRRTSPPNVPAPAGGGVGLPDVLKILMWAVIVIGGLALVLLIVQIFLRTKPTETDARVLSRQQIRDALESGDALALGSGGWLGEADRLAAEQDFRAVYRALYLALLSGLHTAGKIEHSPSRTNWTYVNRYRGPADERQTFGDLTGVFDRVWYGRQVAAGDDLGELRTKVARLAGAAS